jgi:integrase/recombinase XerD
LCRQNILPSNPASELELPRGEKRLPKAVLTAGETERILSVPDIKTTTGLRDRAMLEVFYSTGMRRMELAGLKLHDLDAERGTVMIRQGKGKKDRLIPMGDRAFQWVRKYAEDARPSLACEPDDGTVFLTNDGTPLEPGRLTQHVSAIVRAAGLEKRGSCHMFRHTCATLMLENGADVRFIQQQLGHVDLSTTQIYTQVSVRMLKEVHTRTHPAATLERPERPGESEPATLAAS